MIHKPSLAPRKPKRKCPLCGAMKIGLADHIRDKHRAPRPERPNAPPHLTPAKLDCADCGAPMKLRGGSYGLFYGCTDWSKTGCKGSHGAHLDGSPKGTPGDSRTRKMRMAAHNAFDPLWRDENPRFESRGQAYAWMGQALDKSPEQAHIAMFDIADCVALVEAIWTLTGE